MYDQNSVEKAGTVRREVEEFLSEHLIPALCKFREEFRSPLKEWFSAIRGDIQRLRKDDDLHYKYSIDSLTAGFPDLKKILTHIQKEGWHQQFKDVIVGTCSSLPEEITEEQGEIHFQSSEDDSATAAAVKAMKRTRRSLTGRTPVRTVKLRQLVMNKLLNDSAWIENFAAREYDELAMLTDLLLEKRTSKHDEKENEEKAKEQTSFQLELFLDLENHLQVAVQHLKQFEEFNQHQLEQIIEPVADSLRKQSEEAGTFALRQNVQPDSEVCEFPASVGDRLEKQKEAWCRYLESQQADLKIQAEIARYGFIASSVKEDVLSMSHEFFRDTFYLPIEGGVTKLREAEEELDKLSSDSGKAMNSNLKELHNRLQDDLQSHLIDAMAEEESLMVPVRRMQNLISDLQVETRRFSDELQLAKKRESKYPLPQLQFDTIRWQALASRFLKENAFRPLDPATQTFDQLLAEVRIDVSEAVKVADVNLLAALESVTSDEKGEEPLVIAKEGIRRAINTLEKSIRDVRQNQNAYTEIATVKLPTAMHRLAQIMLKRDFESFELKDKALMVKEQAVNWKQILISKWAAFEDRMELFWRFIVIKFKTASRFIGPYIGFEPNEVVTVKEKRNLVEYLAKPGSKRDLPFIYRRLFDRDFSIDDRFYVPPKNSVDMITNSYDQWKRGLHSNVAVIGEKGSGKSTMIRFAKETILSDTKPLELHFENTFITEAELLKKLCGILGFKTTTNRNEFVEKVNLKKNPSVVVVENLQNIFVRNVNGYEALDAFWVVMSATMHKLFWVVSCSRYAWTFFMKMSSADQYFSHTVYADQLDDKEIRDAIMLRHKATGYELEFEPDDYLKNSRAYKKVIGDKRQSQELIKENFFSRLSKISEGNPSIAMIFWLQSIKEFDERRFLFSPIEIMDVDKLEAPSRDVLFTLACLVLHDNLTKEGVAMALHEDLSQSRLMLARLKTKGIVYESDTGFNLNHLVYRQVVRLLKKRNILH